ncbi:hypothetical protein UF75_0068 [Desulfosporosinus sp. I2]|nr:hypothetical protein UF75_0068 [Desulfosporosinus sp. I2]
MHKSIEGDRIGLFFKRKHQFELVLGIIIKPMLEWLNQCWSGTPIFVSLV